MFTDKHKAKTQHWAYEEKQTQTQADSKEEQSLQRFEWDM
jgi:hypothetical protein